MDDRLRYSFRVIGLGADAALLKAVACVQLLIGVARRGNDRDQPKSLFQTLLTPK